MSLSALAWVTGVTRTPPPTPPATPPLSPRSEATPTPTPPASEPVSDDETVPTGDEQQPRAAGPPPQHRGIVARMPAPEAAAKLGVNVYEELTRPGGARDGANAFDARCGPRRVFERFERAHGADAHAAAIALQRSFHAIQRGRLEQAQARRAMAARPAGMPSRAPPRPAWAVRM